MFCETQFTQTVNELLDLAHQVATETDTNGWYRDWYHPSEYRYGYFELSVSPSFEEGVVYLARIEEERDCSCCPPSVFAHGRGKNAQEALDALRANILSHIPSHTVGDEWKPTLGDLMAN